MARKGRSIFKRKNRIKAHKDVYGEVRQKKAETVKQPDIEQSRLTVTSTPA